MRALSFLLLFSLAFTVLGCPQPQPAKGSIRGTVSDNLGAPIAGATVALQGAGTSATSDAVGAYSLKGLSPGPHTLIASATGYLPETASATVSAGVASILDFTLQPAGVEGPTITPASGEPGTPVTITGAGFDADSPELNHIYFGADYLIPVSASESVLVTAAPLTAPGVYGVSVRVGAETVVDGLTFTILPPPALEDEPGAVTSRMQADAASIAADTAALLGDFMSDLAAEEAEGLQQGFDLIALQIEAIRTLLDEASQEERQALDEVLLSSGLADALSSVRKDLRAKTLEVAWLQARAEETRLKLGGAPGIPESAVVPQLRFTLDWTAGRLHHAMDYANVAMLGLTTAASFGGGAFTLGVGLAGVVAGTLNNVYTIIEATPMQLKEDSLRGQVGETGNTVATNSGAYVVFWGTFEPEASLDSVLLGTFLPDFLNQLGLGPAITTLLMQLAGGLMSAAGGGQHLIPIFSETEVPIFAYDFVDDPPTVRRPPILTGGRGATLDVMSSTIQTGDEESDGMVLTASQDVYEFKGSFWDPGDRPRVETRTETCSVLVKVKRGYRAEVSSPADGARINDTRITVEGHVTNWDGSPIGKGGVTVAVATPAETIEAEVGADGAFSVSVRLSSGQNRLTVTVTDGETTGSRFITIWNAALPAVYAAVVNRWDNDISFVDPVANLEVLRYYDGELDAPRDAAFLRDGEILAVLNSPGEDAEAFIVFYAVTDLDSVAPRGPGVMLGTGYSASLAEDAGILLCPLHRTDEDGATVLSEVVVVDARSVYTPRVADRVTVPAYDEAPDYGPVNVAAFVAQDGRRMAALTVGAYQDNGPSHLVLLDVTNPYSATISDAVPLSTRGGTLAPVPGGRYILVAGTTVYDGDAMRIDGGADLVDVGAPEGPTVTAGLDWTGSFILSCGVTPDGRMGLIADAGQPLSAANRLVFLDLDGTGGMTEAVSPEPLPFGGLGCKSLAVSADGRWVAVVANASDQLVNIDLADPSAPLAATPVDVGDLPYTAVFSPFAEK